MNASTIKHHSQRASRLFSLAERSLGQASRRGRLGLPVHIHLDRAHKLLALSSEELKRCRYV